MLKRNCRRRAHFNADKISLAFDGQYMNNKVNTESDTIQKIDNTCYKNLKSCYKCFKVQFLLLFPGSKKRKYYVQAGSTLGCWAILRSLSY